MENNKNYQPLKAGGKVYLKTHSGRTDNVYYKFQTVERLTKTQAVLSDGTKLVNTAIDFGYNMKEVGFAKYGDSYERWQRETPIIIEEAKAEYERQLINKWFNDKKFDQDEIRKIYNLLNTKDDTKK